MLANTSLVEQLFDIPAYKRNPDFEKLGSLLLERLPTGEKQTISLPLRWRKDPKGKIYWIKVTITLLGDSKGDPDRFRINAQVAQAPKRWPEQLKLPKKNQLMSGFYIPVQKAGWLKFRAP